jgi:hypothetical protein
MKKASCNFLYFSYTDYTGKKLQEDKARTSWGRSLSARMVKLTTPPKEPFIVK